MSNNEDPLTVVVTGATAGVGRATVRAFADRGANLVLIARGRAGLDAAVKEVEERGARALAIPCDVTDADAIDEAAALAEERFGAIDVWVNNAMATIFSPISELDPDEYRRATEVTYFGYVWGTMAALRRMRPRDRGTIVQVGSALAYRAIPLQAPYCGAKFAIRAFTDSLRTELLHDRSKVHVTMVQLPAVNTPQFEWGATHLEWHPQPVPPIFQPEVAADAVVFAATHRRREVWVGGRAAAGIAMAKLVPGVLDHFLARTAWSSQLMHEPVRPQRRCNLSAPADDDEDFGAHGRFDRRASTRSWQLALSKLRPSPGLLARPVGAAMARWLG